jgi:hypothetical protein
LVCHFNASRVAFQLTAPGVVSCGSQKRLEPHRVSMSAQPRERQQWLSGLTFIRCCEMSGKLTKIVSVLQVALVLGNFLF